MKNEKRFNHQHKFTGYSPKESATVREEILDEVEFLTQEKQELLKLMKRSRENGNYSDYKMHIKNLQEVTEQLNKIEPIYNQDLYNLNKDQLIELITFYSNNGYSFLANTDVSEKGVIMNDIPILVNNKIEGIKPDYIVTGNLEFKESKRNIYTKIVTENDWVLSDIDEDFKTYTITIPKSEYKIDDVLSARAISKNGDELNIGIVYTNDYIQFKSLNVKGDAKLVIIG